MIDSALSLPPRVSIRSSSCSASILKVSALEPVHEIGQVDAKRVVEQGGVWLQPARISRIDYRVPIAIDAHPVSLVQDMHAESGGAGGEINGQVLGFDYCWDSRSAQDHCQVHGRASVRGDTNVTQLGLR